MKVPDLDDIMQEGVGLSDALAFWSHYMSRPQRGDWRKEVIHIKLFEARSEDHHAWVAQCQPGGPDLTAQGPSPEAALERLALAIRAEKQIAGRNLDQVPKW